jgi:anaerobic ribonucleoside-triphosphate reductase activating protein
LPATGGREFEAGQLAREVLQVTELQGITLSGGEPFAQAAGLADVLYLVARRRPDLTVICYSGFTRAQIERQGARDGGVRRLLRRLDVLIDGQYRHELNDSRGLRGSANQGVHFLTSRIPPDRAAFETSPRRLEMLGDGEGLLLEVGVPTLAHWRASLDV